MLIIVKCRERDMGVHFTNLSLLFVCLENFHNRKFNKNKTRDRCLILDPPSGYVNERF